MDIQERRQDHFNKAYLGVIAQGEPSVNTTEGTCVYLSPHGSKCAVGHILSAEELERYGYFQGAVDSLWGRMRDEGFADYDHPFYSDRDFYFDMQEVHDGLMHESGPEFVMAFKTKMKLLAYKYKLEVPCETAVA